MAPTYKLIYFNSQGTAETARFLLKYGGIDFEDIRLDKKAWPQLKNSYPFGQLPVLEHDGKQVGQSIAIARYLGKQVKLAGSNDWENLEIDAVVDTIHDLFSKLAKIRHEEDADKKSSQLRTAATETVPFYLSRLEALVGENGGYLAIGRLTWADFYFVTIAPFFDYATGVESLANYPNLKALKEKVHSLKAIKDWVEVRPDADYLKCK